jgi:hypothetical protein
MKNGMFDGVNHATNDDIATT